MKYLPLLVVPAAGIDALDGSIAEVAHRPELVSGLTGLREDGLRSIYDGDTSIEEVLKYT